MSLPTMHVYWDTPRGREPFTLFVFGPYQPFSAPEWDVEIYYGHIQDEQRSGARYIGTVSDLIRDTHIVLDIHSDMDYLVNNIPAERY